MGRDELVHVVARHRHLTQGKGGTQGRDQIVMAEQGSLDMDTLDDLSNILAVREVDRPEEASTMPAPVISRRTAKYLASRCSTTSTGESPTRWDGRSQPLVLAHLQGGWPWIMCHRRRI